MTIPLEIIDLSKTYDTKEAVRDISFKVNENEIIGLLGPNGCGKTTTIGMMLGLVTPSEGKILFENKINLSSENINLIIERSQGDRVNLKNELQKIINLSQNNKKLELEDILKLTNKYFSKPFLSISGNEKICLEISNNWNKNF